MPRSVIPRAHVLLGAAATAAAGAVAALTTHLSGASQDSMLFADAGQRLLSRDGLEVFADPKLQTGPLHLAFAGGAGRLAAAATWSADVVMAFVLTAVAAVVLLLLPRLTMALRLGLLAACTLGGPVTVLSVDGHHEELLVAGALLAAAATAHRQPLLCGVLIGAAADLKLWGVLGIPILLLTPGRRQQLTAAVGALAALAVAYLPFLVAGSVRTFEYVWIAAPPSAVALAVPTGTVYGWPLRLLQGAVVVAMASWVARRARGQGTWAAVPACVISARLLTDPNVLAYYWAAYGVAVFCVVWSLPRLNLDARLRWSVALCVVTALAMFVPGRFGSVVQLVVLVATLSGLVRLTRPRT
jgi:hypothetical protein